MTASAKLDMKKALKEFYAPSARQCALVDVPALNILFVDGAGDPNTSQDFSDAISALYTTSFTLKFMLKGRGGWPDYSVMPLEALWWVDDWEGFSLDNKNEWSWRALIVQPEHVTAEMVQEAMAEARKKKALLALEKVQFERFTEGLSAQVLHLGPYAQERPTVERLHAFIAEQGYAPIGKHHEIYLSDPGRTAPDRLKTVVRQPVARPI